MGKCVILSIALAKPGTILPVVREITRTKKVYKRIILEAKWKCSKGLLNTRHEGKKRQSWHIIDTIKLWTFKWKNATWRRI